MRWRWSALWRTWVRDTTERVYRPLSGTSSRMLSSMLEFVFSFSSWFHWTDFLVGGLKISPILQSEKKFSQEIMYKRSFENQSFQEKWEKSSTADLNKISIFLSKVFWAWRLSASGVFGDGRLAPVVSTHLHSHQGVPRWRDSQHTSPH